MTPYTKMTLPNTTNTTLEVFSVPTKKYIGHELTVWLPWFIRRHVFRQNIPKPPAIIATAKEVAPSNPPTYGEVVAK